MTDKCLQTDSTRAQDAELKVQARVNSELQRLRDTQAQQLSDLTSSLTTDPPAESPTSTAPSTGLAAYFSSPFYQDHSGGNPAAAPAPDSGRSHDSVQKEIMDLKAKLEARKKTDKASPAVETAKEKLVQCLRTNDRRPLDCWKEVETFKAEVGKLEKAFIEKAGR